MNLYDGKVRLRNAGEKLRLRWEETQTEWRDAVSQDFERQHLETLGPPIQAALRAIDALSEILSWAEQECRA